MSLKLVSPGPLVWWQLDGGLDDSSARLGLRLRPPLQLVLTCHGTNCCTSVFDDVYIAAHNCSMKGECTMQAINLDNIETFAVQSELDPTSRVRVGFPDLQRDGHGRERERLLRARSGRASRRPHRQRRGVPDHPRGRGRGPRRRGDRPVKAGDVVVVPAMVRHGLTNTGTERPAGVRHLRGLDEHRDVRGAVR